MENIKKAKAVVNNLETAVQKLALSTLPEETKNKLYQVLQNIAEKPLECEEIFSKNSSYLVNSSKNNPKTIGAEIPLSEQKENCELVFSKMLIILPQIKQQLLSMKGKGFFILQEEITKTKTRRLRRPSKGIIGDYGDSIDDPIKAKYNKVELTDDMVDQLINEIDEKIKETEILMRSTNNLQVADNIFISENMEKIQKKAEKGKGFVSNLYKKINSYFPQDSFQEKVWDKEFHYDGDFHKNIRKHIHEKDSSLHELSRVFSNIFGKKQVFGSSLLDEQHLKKEQKLEKGSILIFDLPEIDELCKIQLGKVKEIPNPNYESKQKYIEELQSTIELLSIVLSADMNEIEQK